MKKKIVATLILLVIALFIAWYFYKEHMKHESILIPKQEALRQK